MTGKAIDAMVTYYQGDTARINHALKVFGYAKAIAESETLLEEEQQIVELAAVLHDIGIPESERIYGSSAGKYQEEQGVLIGRQLLEEIHCRAELVEPILFLIGHHHSYGTDGGLTLQILFEADFIVNLEEGNLGNASPRQLLETRFQTKQGKKLLEAIFLSPAQ